MSRYDRNRLHFGPYRTPRFRYGAKVDCKARGELRIVGLSNGRIPWPLGLKGSRQSPVVFGALSRAIRREAACAVGCFPSHDRPGRGVGAGLFQEGRAAGIGNARLGVSRGT